MSYMDSRATLAGNGGIMALNFDEIDVVGGASDARVIATGITVIAGGILLAECPPAAGAVISLGVHIVMAGIALD